MAVDEPVTRAPRGPWPSQARARRPRLSAAAFSSTVPSGSLRTQPSTPRRRASCAAEARNPTPWTRPARTARTVFRADPQLGRRTRGRRQLARPLPRARRPAERSPRAPGAHRWPRQHANGAVGRRPRRQQPAPLGRDVRASEARRAGDDLVAASSEPTRKIAVPPPPAPRRRRRRCCARAAGGSRRRWPAAARVPRRARPARPRRPSSTERASRQDHQRPRIAGQANRPQLRRLRADHRAARRVAGEHPEGVAGRRERDVAQGALPDLRGDGRERWRRACARAAPDPASPPDCRPRWRSPAACRRARCPPRRSWPRALPAETRAARCAPGAAASSVSTSTTSLARTTASTGARAAAASASTGPPALPSSSL